MARRRRVPRDGGGVPKDKAQQVIWMFLQEAGVQAKGSCPKSARGPRSSMQQPVTALSAQPGGAH